MGHNIPSLGDSRGFLGESGARFETWRVELGRAEMRAVFLVKGTSCVNNAYWGERASYLQDTEWISLGLQGEDDNGWWAQQGPDHEWSYLTC